jgi:signal transduction histidine kinase
MDEPKNGVGTFNGVFPSFWVGPARSASARLVRRTPASRDTPGAAGGGTTAAGAGPPEAVIEFHHRAAIERLLANARFVAAVVLFVAMRSSTDLLHTPAASLLMGAYALHAALLLAIAWTRPSWVQRGATPLHLLDLAWAAAATAVSGGASSHVVPLFTFVLVAAAFRWGFWRTVVDAAMIVAVVAAEGLAALTGLTPWPFEFDWFVLWVCYIGVLAALFGLLSQRHYTLTFHAVAIGQVVTRVTRATGLAPAIESALAETVRLFGAGHVRLVIQEVATGRSYGWQADAAPTGEKTVPLEALAPVEQQDWLFPLPANVCTFEVRQRVRGERRVCTSLALDAAGSVVESPLTAPARLAGVWPWTSLLGVVVTSHTGWRGRVYVFDSTLSPGGKLRLGLLQALVSRVGPVLTELYQLQGLRARAESRERARVSRELHDGIVQSLAGLEMRLEVLRRRAEAIAPGLSAELMCARDQVHEETVSVRELMESLRPVDLNAARLQAALADLVGRFARNTGICARLDWSVGSFEATPRECQEVFRVVQEALVNVRRHSAATQAIVRIESADGGRRLVVEDNGCGLQFTGRLTHDALEARGTGPRVIRERVAALGGTLAVESHATGTRLEITVPDTTRTFS